MMELTVLTPTPEDTLASLIANGINLAQVQFDDAFTLRFRVNKADCRKIVRFCKSRNYPYTLARTGRFHWTALKYRPVLLLGISLILFLSLYLPTRVLFIRVEGNQTVPANRILEAAGEEGICFGTPRRQIRSEEVKNALLESIPQLRWVGVNTRGCVAIIRVEEDLVQNTPPTQEGLQTIVAANDGIVLSATATSGRLLCSPGQAVTRGQVLISPYRDCGICILAENAQGEIMAQTRREINAISPSTVLSRGEIRDRQVNFSLLLGKKRINLWKGSGISSGVCGRMYEEYYITLPGGWVLPIAIGKETVVSYRLQEDLQHMDQDAIARYARETMLRRTIAGSITREQVFYETWPEAVFLSGDYLCTEMICRVRSEKIGELHGESN